MHYPIILWSDYFNLLTGKSKNYTEYSLYALSLGTILYTFIMSSLDSIRCSVKNKRDILIILSVLSGVDSFLAFTFMSRF